MQGVRLARLHGPLASPRRPRLRTRAAQELNITTDLNSATPPPPPIAQSQIYLNHLRNHSATLIYTLHTPTMADYTQLKVPDLKKILQERGLVVSGNKADLIARLQEDDKKAGGATGMITQFMRSAAPASICAQC